MKTTVERLRELIKEELMREQGGPLGSQPFRTGLSAYGWEGMNDPRDTGTEQFPVTGPEALGEAIADAIHNGIRGVLGASVYDKFEAEVDDPVLDISMYLRDAVLGLLGQPEGVTSELEAETGFIDVGKPAGYQRKDDIS